MFSVFLSQLLLDSLSLRWSIAHQERIPEGATLLVVSNHRSFMDALLLLQAVNHPLHLVCHPYMAKVPILKETVALLGGLPLDRNTRRFLTQATTLLNQGEGLGIFPEGATPMVRVTAPWEVGKFALGFTHLAYGSKISNLVVLPVAIASLGESVYPSFPLKLLEFFDPAEPLFASFQSHPVVWYHQVKVVIGNPYQITQKHQLDYRCQQKRGVLIRELQEHCQGEIAQILKTELCQK